MEIDPFDQHHRGARIGRTADQIAQAGHYVLNNDWFPPVPNRMMQISPACFFADPISKGFPWAYTVSPNYLYDPSRNRFKPPVAAKPAGDRSAHKYRLDR